MWTLDSDELGKAARGAAPSQMLKLRFSWKDFNSRKPTLSSLEWPHSGRTGHLLVAKPNMKFPVLIFVDVCSVWCYWLASTWHRVLVSPAVSSLSSHLFTLFSPKCCWSPFLTPFFTPCSWKNVHKSKPSTAWSWSSSELSPESTDLLAHTFSEWLHRHSCYLYCPGTQTCISSPYVLQTVIMGKNTDTHIFISLLGITWVSKRHLELQMSKSIIGSSPSSLTFDLHVTYISGWPPHFSIVSHKYPLHSHCAKNFSSFIPEIVESLFNVPSFSPCHPFISVLLSQPFWNADSIVMCLCQKPFHDAFWERLWISQVSTSGFLAFGPCVSLWPHVLPLWETLHFSW